MSTTPHPPAHEALDPRGQLRSNPDSIPPSGIYPEDAAVTTLMYDLPCPDRWTGTAHFVIDEVSSFDDPLACGYFPFVDDPYGDPVSPRSHPSAALLEAQLACDRYFDELSQ